MRKTTLAVSAVVLAAATAAAAAAVALVVAGPSAAHATAKGPGLWQVYDERSRRRATSTSRTRSRRTCRSGRASARRSSRRRVNPATGAPYTYAHDGFEATAYPLVDRPVRHAARPAGALGARVPGDRRAAADLRGAAARRDLDRRRRSQQQPDYALQVSDIEAWERQHGTIPRGLGRDGALGLVEALDRRPAKAKPRSRPGLPGRVARRAEVPAPEAPHPVPRPRAARHGHDADARGRVLADAPRLHAGRGRRQPRRVPGDGCLVAIGYPKFKGGLGGYARYVAICPRRRGEGRAISGRDAPLPRYGDRCTGTRNWATASAEPPDGAARRTRAAPVCATLVARAWPARGARTSPQLGRTPSRPAVDIGRWQSEAALMPPPVGFEHAGRRG